LFLEIALWYVAYRSLSKKLKAIFINPFSDETQL
jgi:hypothetical protein